MKVLKFGGSSVKNKENILKVYSVLKTQFFNQGPFTVVVSAFGGVTDQLIEMSALAAKGDISYLDVFKAFSTRHHRTAKELLSPETYDKIKPELDQNHSTLKNLLHGVFLVRECSPRTMDYVLSFGERNSAFIIGNAFNEREIPSAFLDARKIITTDKSFGSAIVNFKITEEKTKRYYKNHADVLHIVTGFIASDIGGLTTTLGRGGSDYSASILSAALNAEALEIWTDVDGVLTCDPRKVKKAFTIPSLSYKEAMELSHFGAKVIYPPTIQPALLKDIPIYIRNTFNPDFKGTLINKETTASLAKEITGLSSLSDIALLSLQGSGLVGIPGISGRLFSSLAKEGINVILITQGSSEHSISFAVKEVDAKRAKLSIETEFEKEIAKKYIEPVGLETELAIIAVVGEQMRSIPGVAGKLFTALGKNGVNVIAIAQGSSELNISFVVQSEDAVKALNLIHDSFFLSGSRTMHLFMVGVGLIGGTLLDQINTNGAKLLEEQQLDLCFSGLSNSKKMLFSETGIALESWKKNLQESEIVSSPSAFVDKMIAMNLPNSVFIDSTANAQIPNEYKRILDANISIVTPNKVATSSSYKDYLSLKSLAQKKNIDFLYETNVGAGLPIISTIKNLISSGDKIIKLDAVLSGTISYIFNNFDSSKDFSAIVKEAQDKGLTEPDPRDDLSGTDVRRKITILSREAGIPLEMENVTLDKILPQSCLDAGTVEEFYTELKKNDAVFHEMVSSAEKENKKLRYIARLENGEASVMLLRVGEDDPFYSLEGSDNMIALTTNRYASRPLVVKGPGAGADVTAAGVFAELLSIASKQNS